MHRALLVIICVAPFNIPAVISVFLLHCIHKLHNAHPRVLSVAVLLANACYFTGGIVTLLLFPLIDLYFQPSFTLRLQLFCLTMLLVVLQFGAAIFLTSAWTCSYLTPPSTQPTRTIDDIAVGTRVADVISDAPLTFDVYTAGFLDGFESRQRI